MMRQVVTCKAAGCRAVLLLMLFALVLLGGCDAAQDRTTSFSRNSEKKDTGFAPLRYARRFTMERIGNATLVDIVKPAGAKLGVAFRYLLVPKGGKVPEGYPDALVVRTPVERVTCGIGLHITMLQLLDELEGVVGVGRAQWIGNREILEKIDSGAVLETGLSGAMNMETVLSLQPDLAFVFSSGSDTDIHEKLLDIGIKPGLSSMHLEEHPLGVLEWIKFFGAFFQKEKEANAYFSKMAARYEMTVKELRYRFKKRPGVIVGRGKKGFWSTHGSSAWFVRFLQDAGAEYVLEDSADYEENPVSFEHAMKIGLVAEYWVNPDYTAQSINDIIASDGRYVHFFAVRKGNVYNNDAARFENGRNMFWEIGMSEPDAILRDLVHIFHPEILPVHRLKYYKRLH